MEGGVGTRGREKEREPANGQRAGKTDLDRGLRQKRP